MVWLVVLSRPFRWTVALVAAQVLLLWATLHVPGLGEAMWHHAASLGLVLALVVLLRARVVRSRRVLAVWLLGLSVLAVASGFWLLYFKEGIRVDGYQDWGVWWHVLWSWAWMVFFVLHTWINWVPFVLFVKKSVRGMPGAVWHGSFYLLLMVGLVVTWSPWGRDWFTNDIYIPLSLYTWLVVVVPAYAVWLYVRLFGASARDPVTMALTRRWALRRWVDLGLVPISVLTVLSGIVLTFLDGVTDAFGWKYVSKYWHVWPSVVFTLLAFVHTVQVWKTMKVHWRDFDRVREPAPKQVVPAADTDA